MRADYLCVPNIMSLGISFKKVHLIKVGAFAWYSVHQNSRYFRCPVWKTKS